MRNLLSEPAALASHLTSILSKVGEGRTNLHRALFPSVLFANVRSLETKMDGLNLKLAMNKEVRECCAIILTGTWLKSSIPDNAISKMGFLTFWLDRNCALSGKFLWWGYMYLY